MAIFFAIQKNFLSKSKERGYISLFLQKLQKIQYFYFHLWLKHINIVYEQVLLKLIIDFKYIYTSIIKGGQFCYEQ